MDIGLKLEDTCEGVHYFSVTNGGNISRVRVPTNIKKNGMFDIFTQSGRDIEFLSVEPDNTLEENIISTIKESSIYLNRNILNFETTGQLIEYLSQFSDDTRIFNTGCGGTSVRTEVKGDDITVCMDEYGFTLDE